MEGATHAIPWIRKVIQDLIFLVQPGMAKLQLILCFYRYPSALNYFSLRASFVHGTAIFLCESAGTAVWYIKHSLWRVCIKFKVVEVFFPLKKKWKYIWFCRKFLQCCCFSPVFQQIKNFQNYKMHFLKLDKKKRFLP